MAIHLKIAGPLPYRIKRAAELSQWTIETATHRVVKGPRRPGWNWFVEVTTHVLRRQLMTAFSMADVNQARNYLDAIEISSPASPQVEVTKYVNERFKGAWIVPVNADRGITVLYLHGGGYSFYPRSYKHFVALITVAAKARTFALDYRLSPEHRFPSQLEDAINAYRWMLASGCAPEEVVVIGDSAGANLALALVLTARESGIALPALVVAMSPPTDFESEYPSLSQNEEFDWISSQMLRPWCDWFCEPTQRRDPLISPMWADLRGLPPIYIQAGECEILFDSIRAFADRARQQGADVTLESWQDMNHVFQIFGMESPQSIEALRRMREMIESRVRTSKKNVFCETGLN